MTVTQAVTTMFGGFIFPFLVTLVWGRMVRAWGAIGGWMAAGFIVGSVWMVNHALPGVGFATEMTTSSGLIWQSGDAWVDMAWAAGLGLWVGSKVRGASLVKSLPTLLAAILGGIFGGIIIGLTGR